MCTSFVDRKNDTTIAMNFDNNGMPFEVSTKDPKQFLVLVNGGRGKVPSFGVNSNGTFINHLMADSNGKGIYKRLSKKITHTSKLVCEVLNSTILPNELSKYLEDVEVVNVPNFSVHNMISDKNGNVWVIEPGRGIIYSPADESPHFIMSNFSLCDFMASGNLAGSGADRYKTSKELIDKADDLNVSRAFQILEEVKQNNGEWLTDFSMVYTQKENTVYYCYNGDFKNIKKYSFIS